MDTGKDMTVSRDKKAYCGVFNIDTVRKYLFLGQFNILEVSVMYFGNAYIHIFTRDNIYTVTGPNFGEWEFQVLICVRYIYGLNIFMAMWHEALLYKSNIIVLLPSKVDPDLWI